MAMIAVEIAMTIVLEMMVEIADQLLHLMEMVMLCVRLITIRVMISAIQNKLYNNYNVFTVRLANGETLYEGRVEIFHDGRWGTVCDDGWTTVDAEVVCRQLGFSGGIALDDKEFGEGADPIWLDDIECSGYESSLGDCVFRGWGDHNCGHYEDAGVICGKCCMPLRLHG